MMYAQGKAVWDEGDSHRMHDVLELMRMTHNGHLDDPLLLQAVIRVCRHALDAIQERLRAEEMVRDPRFQKQ